ncbi:MAG TPA: proline--tRNA ligase [Candidatus Nitrosocosmicus sp.]|nr:proline--tRNA ligase [Candidatus Nitrosocosmicus sp.]
MQTDKKYLTKKSENLSKWYLEIIDKAKLADYAPVKGCMVIRPYGYAIWEKIQSTLDTWFKEGGVENAYFPLFIPYSFLEKEKKHVEGFSPELAIVTKAGGEELAEPLVVRPTSETIINTMYANWITSYKDLPMKLNQWCNVVRWEKRTYPFLRTTEFLWQEGHTIHVDEEDAMNMVMQAFNWYKKMFEELMGISVYAGIKSETEKFAGAKQSFSIEIVMPDGKALQAATSHNLGQNFAKVFDITYSDKNNKKVHPHQTSWGLSTRSIGGLISVHGDDNGLILAPRIAPYQVVIVPIFAKDSVNQQKINLTIKKITDRLIDKSISYKISANQNHSFGYRMNEAELQGIPLRIELGEKEIESNKIIISRRDIRDKKAVSIDNLVFTIEDYLEDMQKVMFIKSKEMKEELTINVDDYQKFKEAMLDQKHFIRAYWCESSICERKIKDETKATTRVCEIEEINKNEDGKCIYCGNNARRKWLFAQSY